MGLGAPLRLLAVSAENHPEVSVCLHQRCSVLCPLGFQVKPFSGFSFSAARNLECTPRCSGSSMLSVSLAQKVVYVGGLAFPLIEANSPLYSIKMLRSHLPSMLCPVVEVLSSYVLSLVIILGKMWVIGRRGNGGILL